MPAVSPAGPWACPACRRLLLSRPHLSTQFLSGANQHRHFAANQATRPLQTQEASVQQKQSFTPAQGAIDPPDGKKPQSVKIWTTLLERQTLGASSRVLIMRDVESKRQRSETLQEQQRQKDANQAATVGRLLSSLKLGNLNAAQDDAHQSISSLRPLPLEVSTNRPSCISSAQFKECVAALVNGFNQTQLARYIAASRQNETDNDDVNSVSVMEPPSKDRVSRVSAWVSVAETDTGRATKIFRGKGALANNIVRSVWGFEVSEEVDAIGLLPMQIDPNHLSFFLNEGTNSILRELSDTKGVKIDLDRSTGLIVLTADKYKCLEVADDIEVFLSDIYTVQLDLGLFRKKQSGSFPNLRPEDLVRIANTYLCTITASNAGNKLIIRATKKASADRCQRAIVATYWHLLYRSEEKTLVHRESAEDGILSVTPAGSKSIPFTHRQAALGRFTTAFPMALGWEAMSRGKMRVPRDPLEDEARAISSELLLPEMMYPNPRLEDSSFNSRKSTNMNSGHAHWQPHVHSETLAEPGQCLHRMAEGVLLSQPVTAQSLAGEASSPVFVHSFVGTPHFMISNLSECDPTSWDGLRMMLIPSPWNSRSLADQQAFPPLEMTLSVNFTTKVISVKSLHAILRHRILNVLLPHLGTDVRFHSKQFIKCDNANELPEVEEFVQEIRKTAKAYGTSTPPLTLNLDIPAQAIRPRSGNNASRNSNTQDPVRVQYFATHVEYEESLIHRNFYGAELVLRQIGGGEFATRYQGFQLRCPDAATLASLEGHKFRGLYGNAPHSAEAIARGFVGATSALISEMNFALGNLSMMRMSPEISDRRFVSERKFKGFKKDVGVSWDIEKGGAKRDERRKQWSAGWRGDRLEGGSERKRERR